MKAISLSKVVDNSKYEIKKVREMKALSDETPCFSCELWKDGKKFALVSNEGHGALDTFRYALGVDVPGDPGERVIVEMNLSTLVYELLDLRDEIAALKRQEKKSIVLRKKDGSFCYVPLKFAGRRYTVDEVLAQSSGRKVLKDMIARYKGEGYEVLNTNID